MNQASLLDWTPTVAPKGETFDSKLDGARLGKQLQAVAACMADGKWRGLNDISLEVHAPEASVSARLRQLRNCGFTVERMRANDRGLWIYRVTGGGQ